jgi:uncharacterized surface protein with fasciclin (FAS1) repeats
MTKEVAAMNGVQRKALVAAGITASVVAGSSACKAELKPSGSEDETTTVTATTSVIITSTSPAPAPATTTSSATPAGTPVGPGCGAYEQQVPTGPGSIAGMTKDPVTIAASNNPELTTLTNAVSGKLNPDVNLIDTLNKGEYTVFAPTDQAFGKLDPATMERLKTDAPFLNSILTYHVVNGQLTPAQVDGVHQTLDANTTLTVNGETNDLHINNAGVTCGGITTANAQVYMIDTVLMPPGQ